MSFIDTDVLGRIRTAVVIDGDVESVDQIIDLRRTGVRTHDRLCALDGTRT